MIAEGSAKLAQMPSGEFLVSRAGPLMIPLPMTVGGAVAVASGGGGATAGGDAAEEKPKEEAKKEESEEESDDDMGFGLFD